MSSFSSSITIGSERTYLGTFGSAKEAARAFDQAAIKAMRKQKKSLRPLNFPQAKARKAKRKRPRKKEGKKKREAEEKALKQKIVEQQGMAAVGHMRIVKRLNKRIHKVKSEIQLENKMEEQHGMEVEANTSNDKVEQELRAFQESRKHSELAEEHRLIDKLLFLPDVVTRLLVVLLYVFDSLDVHVHN